MKFENKHSVLIWAVVALVILNLTTLATIFYNRTYSTRADETKTESLVTDDKQEDNFSGRYFRDKLSLTPSQMREFQKFNPEFRSEARSINIRLNQLRNAMLDELASDKPDNNKLDALSDSIGNQHARLKHITYLYYLNFKTICTPDQRNMLRDLFSGVLGNDNITTPGNMQGRRGPSRGGPRNNR
jgi:Spy/CpxP family protein refolding chaperone